MDALADHAPPASCGAGPSGSLVVERATFPPAHRGRWHCIDRGQLIYPSRGVMTLYTRGGVWVVPPLRGCWLPANEEHRVETTTGLEMHSLYCRNLASLMPNRCGIVPVGPLLRELILALAQLPPDHPGATVGEKLDALLLNQLVVHPEPPLFLPNVDSPPLRRIAEALRADPADPRRLQDWADELGTTTRSLARAFAREARMSFTEFRRQARLHASLEMLGAGQSVTAVALDLGFSSAANFISMFRRATGSTPKAYFGTRWSGAGRPALR